GQRQAAGGKKDITEVPEVCERPGAHISRLCQRALDLHDGDDQSKQDVLNPERNAKRQRPACHVAMIVAARHDGFIPEARSGTTTSAIGYVSATPIGVCGAIQWSDSSRRASMVGMVRDPGVRLPPQGGLPPVDVATGTVVEIACDESGFSGTNLLD